MLLSICIPTYNRVEFLTETIKSIVSQPEWDSGNVEIVVSDNCSTDNTPVVLADFQQQYGSKIRFVHLENAVDTHDNFSSALDLGQGRYLKLQNDTCQWAPGALARFVELLKSENGMADLLLTPNCGGTTTVFCRSMDEVVENVSYYLTWIGTITISRETWQKIDDPMRYRDLKLPQVDLVARVMSSGGSALFCREKFFDVQEIGHRVGYQVAEVFCKNYYFILSAHISRKTFASDRKRLIREYLIWRHFDFFREYNSVPQKGYWQNTVVCHRDISFYFSFLKIAFYWLISRFFSHEQLRKIKHLLQRKKIS